LFPKKNLSLKYAHPNNALSKDMAVNIYDRMRNNVKKNAQRAKTIPFF